MAIWLSTGGWPGAKRAAAAAQPAVRARKVAALRPAKTGFLQNLFGRNKK